MYFYILGLPADLAAKQLLNANSIAISKAKSAPKYIVHVNANGRSASRGVFVPNYAYRLYARGSGKSRSMAVSRNASHQVARGFAVSRSIARPLKITSYLSLPGSLKYPTSVRLLQHP